MRRLMSTAANEDDHLFDFKMRLFVKSIDYCHLYLERLTYFVMKEHCPVIIKLINKNAIHLRYESGQERTRVL